MCLGICRPEYVGAFTNRFCGVSIPGVTATLNPQHPASPTPTSHPGLFTP